MTEIVSDAALADAVSQSRQRYRDAVVWLGRLLVLGGLLALWQFGSGRWFSAYWFSDPALVAKRLLSWTADGSLLANTLFTLTEMAIGLIVGCVTGVATGFVLGLSPRVAGVLEPVIIALYNVPKLALAPMFILWFGIDMGPKIVLVALVTFFLMFINTLSGVRDVNRDLINIMRIMGAGLTDLVTKLLLPAAAPFIQTGLRISLPYALTAAVAGEMMLSQQGLGYVVRRSADVMDMSGMYAALMILLILGIALDLLAGAARFSKAHQIGEAAI